MQTEESAEKGRGAPGEPDRLAFLSRLAGGLAHEIKNPLSTMSINLALLEEEWGRSNDPGRPEPSAREKRCLKRLHTLRGEVRRLENIVEDFLRYARGGVINRSPCDLPGLLREVLEFSATEDEQLDIRHHLELPSTLPLVMLDSGMFRQALMNLVVNARQAMPSGGELIVRLKRRGNFAELTLTDTGVGMGEEDLERCFDIYWSTKRDGSGLGLATVRRIVEEHDGTIAVVSERGRGTSFSIVLPLVVEITHGAGGDAEEGEEGEA
ncbi:MAG: ATP-binding protein [Planctomycetota bacterium]|jgi:signal transduction histidine kinase|nr:ATP-binding protein [Planctomycetota bacterium]MDP6762953.1 ATP-binding protein [Planctomycetota bacterium]MDP6987867.1 ATP-binding protein [Planctomycetota bacterium]